MSLSSFRQTKHQGVGILSLEILGSIDEMIQFPTLDISDVQRILINLSTIDQVNSEGMRKWIRWLLCLERENSLIKLVFRGIPVNMAKHMAIVSDFFSRNASFESMYVPHFCETCELQADHLVEFQKDCLLDENGKVIFDVEFACPGCKQIMKTDLSSQCMDVVQIFYRNLDFRKGFSY